MDHSELKQLKTQLESKRDELQNRLQSLAQDKKRSAGVLEADFEEQAVQLENDEVVDQLENLELKELQKIQAALNLMEKGNYGECASCGEDISLARLKALPSATLCRLCSEE